MELFMKSKESGEDITSDVSSKNMCIEESNTQWHNNRDEELTQFEFIPRTECIHFILDSGWYSYTPHVEDVTMRIDRFIGEPKVITYGEVIE